MKYYVCPYCFECQKLKGEYADLTRTCIHKGVHHSEYCTDPTANQYCDAINKDDIICQEIPNGWLYVSPKKMAL